MTYVIDASALLASLKEEPGADVVESCIEAGAVISAVNLAEVLGWYRRDGYDTADIEASLSLIDLPVLAFDHEDVGAVANLAEAGSTLGLSLADRVCLGLAVRLEGIAITADRQWAKLGDVVACRIQVIR